MNISDHETTAFLQTCPSFDISIRQLEHDTNEQDEIRVAFELYQIE